MSGELNSLINLSCWEQRCSARTFLGAGMGPPAEHCPASTRGKEQELSLNLSWQKDKACSKAMADFIHSQLCDYCKGEACSLGENTVLPWSSRWAQQHGRRASARFWWYWLQEVQGSHLPIGDLGIASSYLMFLRIIFSCTISATNDIQ